MSGIFDTILPEKKPKKKPTDGLVFKVGKMKFVHKQHIVMQYGDYFIPGYIVIDPEKKNVYLANNYTGAQYANCHFPDYTYHVTGALWYLKLSYGTLELPNKGSMIFNPDKFTPPKGFTIEGSGLEAVQYRKGDNYFKINTKGYPYCCGSTMLYGYYYSGNFSKEDIELLTKTITARTTNTNVIVRGDNTAKGLDFFKAAGFKIVDTWKNRNSGNELHLMSYNKE